MIQDVIRSKDNDGMSQQDTAMEEGANYPIRNIFGSEVSQQDTEPVDYDGMTQQDTAPEQPDEAEAEFLSCEWGIFRSFLPFVGAPIYHYL